MNLTYRGHAYPSSKTVASVNPEKRFIYRGQSYQHYTILTVTPKANLTYRGIPYVYSQSSVINDVIPVFS